MKTILSIFAAAIAVVSSIAADAPKDTRLFEMRIYYAPPGKLDDLHARFRNHTLKIFEKHGIQNIGYWVPVDNAENKLIYVLAYPDREAREKSWKEFFADPDWQKAAKESEVNGKIVAKVESIFMQATDYSPAIKPSSQSPARVFEMRTYTTNPGKLPNLNKRFRDHTVALFAKYGMTNFGYWVPTDKENTLVYILAHKSRDAAKESFTGFGKDPDWLKAREESEKEAGGPLTLSKGGVQSVFMVPTDYSPTR